MTENGVICEKCGAGPEQQHTWSDDDCILDHPDHTPRYVGLICRRHYHWIDRTLDQILGLFSLLSAMPNTGQSDTRGTSDVFAAAPGRLDVMALVDTRNRFPGFPQPSYECNWNGRDLETNGGDYIDILSILGGWARIVVEERPVELDATFLPLTRIIALLNQHRHWIAQQPWIDDYCIELNDVHVALARGARDSMWPSSVGRCPNCTAPLYNTIGVDVITCQKCRSSWTGVHLVRLRLVLEQDAERAG